LNRASDKLSFERSSWLVRITPVKTTETVFFYMLKDKVTILNKEGLHARPSATLVKLASRFESDFFILMQGYRVNGKSILGVMTLAAEYGAELELVVEGKDEEKAMESIKSLFDNNFMKVD